MSTTGFELAGADLSWPILAGPGLTNHPDIEVVANRFEMYSSLGLGGLALGGWKLGGPDGGNGYTQDPQTKKWKYEGGDEYPDLNSGAGYNAKGLPGPGTDNGLERIGDFVDLARSRGVEVTLNLSPHTNEPLEELAELIEVGRKALNKGVLLIEFNLSCPNIPDRPPFYKDTESVQRFYEMLGKADPLVNRFGMPGAYMKFGPMEPGESPLYLPNYSTGGIIRSNTLGGQEPKTEAGQPAIQVNGGKAGMSGPALEELGRSQLVDQGEIDGEIISCLGVSTGREAASRLELGAKAVQITSVLYWPELISCESPAEVAEKIKDGLILEMSS